MRQPYLQDAVCMMGHKAGNHSNQVSQDQSGTAGWLTG